MRLKNKFIIFILKSTINIYVNIIDINKYYVFNEKYHL